MDLRQLEYLVGIVDHGGFTRAAAALHVAQPSLSQSIRRLERELGVAVFVRAGRGVELTAAGRELLGPARQLLRDADALRAIAAGHASLTGGELDVVALPTLVADPLVPLVGRFRQAHPAVRVRVAEPLRPTELLEAVADGRAEVGITEHADTAPGLVVRPLGRQRLLAVLPPGDDVEDPMALEALASRPLLVGPPGTSARDLLDAALAGAGLTPRVAVETSQREAFVPLVLAGAGSAVLPPAMAEDAGRRGAVVRALAPAIERDLALVHRPRSLSAAADAFVALAAAGLTRRRPSPGRGDPGAPTAR